MLRGFLLVAAAAAIATAVVAAPAPPKEGASGFQAIQTKWKATLAELRQLQEKYQLAADTEKPKIEARFNQLLAEGKQLQPQLLASAEKEFIANPNENKEVSTFLLGVVSEKLQGHEHKEAARLAKVLIDNKVADKAVYNLAGMAAFAAGDYAAAEKHFKAAADAKELSDDGKAYRAEAVIRAAEAKADDLPRVKLQTSKGDIVIELFENEAPIAVANFIDLVGKKFYDGLLFHRVLEGFMAQGGDPKGNGSGGPGYHIPCECYEKNFRRHFPGSLSMAHAGRDTGGSQFFLTFVRTDFFDGKHTVFGRVVEGFDVLAKIQRFDPDRPPAVKPKLDSIVKATIERKREHEYKPKKLPEK